jgi:hypothetical protein
MTTAELKEIEVYKKWTQLSNFSGFASFYAWCEGDRVKIEIGETNVDGGGIKSVSTAYVGIYEFLAYLHSEVFGYVDRLYPNMKVNDKWKHGITFFGGNAKVSRVFKIEDWNFKSGSLSSPSDTRRFKVGEFVPKEGTQAIEPDFKQVISNNSLQMKPFEMAELYHHLAAIQQAFETEWMVSGKYHEWMASRLSRRDYIKTLGRDKS